MSQFIQCNVRSLNTSYTFVEDICKVLGTSVLCLTEIWHPNFEQLSLLKYWKWIVSVRGQAQGGGVAIVVNPGNKYIERKDIVDNRIEAVWCEVFINEISYLVCSVYIRPNDVDSLEIFMNILSNINHNQIIITGDFNAKHPAWFNNTSNQLGNKLHDFIASSNYVVINNDSPTYQNNIIDLTLAKGCHSKIVNWDTFPDIFIKSDHNVICFTIGDDPTVVSSKWRINKADWKNWKDKTDILFQQLNIDIDNLLTTDHIYKLIKDSLILAADEIIGKYNSSNKHKIWWNESLSKKLKEVQIAKKLFKKRSTQVNLDKYLHVKHDFFQLYCNERVKYFQSLISDMNHNDNTMWKIIKSNSHIPKPCVQPIINNNIVSFTNNDIAQQFLNTYGSGIMHLDTESLNRTNQLALQYISEPVKEEIINVDFSLNELESALANTPSDCAINPDENIHPQMLKNGGINLKLALLKLANSSLRERRYPSDCKLDHKILLQKILKSNYNSCKSYRPITLESIIGKIIQRMIQNRIDWHLEVNNSLSPTQTAYRKDKNCNDIVLRLVQYVQSNWNL